MPVRTLLQCLLLACAMAVGAADDMAVRKLVEQLVSEDFATRQRAMQELSKLEEVPVALREATKSDDPELRRRAQRVVDVIAARADNKALLEWIRIEVLPPHDPLVVGDKVIVGTDDGQLLAYRCKDGSSVWVHRHGTRILHRPSSDGQRVYFSSEKGLTALKVEDGTEVWRVGLPCGDGPTLVLAKEAAVFVGGSDGILYALDAKTGKQVWASDFLADALPDPPNFAGERARFANTKARPSALASDGETLFLSVADQCRVVAVNATDGKRLWSFQTGGWVFGSAVATKTHVFVGSKDKVFYCLDKRTGNKVWSHETKGRIISGGAVDDQFVYFGSCDGHVYCLNQSDGHERWRFATDKDGRNSDLFGTVLHQGGVYFAAREGQAYAVDQHTGQLNWKVRPSQGSELYASTATDGEFLFVVTLPSSAGNGEPSLVAIRLK